MVSNQPVLLTNVASQSNSLNADNSKTTQGSAMSGIQALAAAAAATQKITVSPQTSPIKIGKQFKNVYFTFCLVGIFFM